MEALEEVYGLACPQLDQDHRVLFSIVERLEAYLHAEPQSDSLERLAAELTAYFATHFENEVGLMEQTGYPEREHHRLEHLKAQSEYEKFAVLIREEPWIARGVLLSLKAWLLRHIGESDRRFAEFLRSR